MPREILGGINAKDFGAAAKALRKAQPLLYKELGADLNLAAKAIAKDAIAIVSAHSTSIPGTIKTRRRGLTYAAVEAGGVVGGAKIAREIQGGAYGTAASSKAMKSLETQGEGLALAGLYELGNKGARSAPSTGTFRHPIFGNWDVGSGGADDPRNQKRWAYLVPAGEKNRASTEALIQRTLDRVTEVIVLED